MAHNQFPHGLGRSPTRCREHSYLTRASTLINHVQLLTQAVLATWGQNQILSPLTSLNTLNNTKYLSVMTTTA